MVKRRQEEKIAKREDAVPCKKKKSVSITIPKIIISNSIPSDSIFLQDLQYLDDNELLDFNAEATRLIQIFAIQGHATSGDREFYPIISPNVDYEHVANALFQKIYQTFKIADMSKDEFYTYLEKGDGCKRSRKRRAEKVSLDEFRQYADLFVKIKDAELIREYEDFIVRAIDGKSLEKFVTEDNKPLFGMNLHKEYRIHSILSMLRGSWMGFMMDNSEVRSVVADTFTESSTSIGMGETYLVDRNKIRDKKDFISMLAENKWSKGKIKELKEGGLNVLSMLAEYSWSGKEIRDLRRIGVIVCKDELKDSEEVGQVYIRHKVGSEYKGIHDGLAVWTGAFIEYTNQIRGGYSHEEASLMARDVGKAIQNADFIDTIEKNIIVKNFREGGWDTKIAQMIKDNEEKISRQYGVDFHLDEFDLHSMIFLALIPQGLYGRHNDEIGLISPSTRYFNIVQNGSTNLRDKLALIEGKIPINRRLGPKNVRVSVKGQLRLLPYRTTQYDEIDYIYNRINEFNDMLGKEKIIIPPVLNEFNLKNNQGSLDWHVCNPIGIIE